MTTKKPPSLFDGAIVKSALLAAARKLDPRHMARNPVMFVVEVGSVIVTVLFFKELGSNSTQENLFAGLIALWLWFTVLFANFAEAMAEGRGKAQAETLRRTRSETLARRRREDGTVEEVPSAQLVAGDVVIVSMGQVIPADGDVIEGIASVDESAITGESAPVIRESGGDRSAVTGGTRVLSDEIVVHITAKPGESFLDRMIALVEGASRRRHRTRSRSTSCSRASPSSSWLAVVTLQPFAIYSDARQSTIVLVALLVCLIPTTIGALLSAIGIAGMDRLVQRNVLALSGRAVEAAGDCDVLLLDKTGTITLGNRQATDLVPAPGVTDQELADAAQLASLADETPEGRSIVVLAKERFDLRERDLHGATLVAVHRADAHERHRHRRTPRAQGRRGRRPPLGRGDRGHDPGRARRTVDEIAASGGTPLVVAENGPRAGSRPPEGRRQGGHARAVRRAAAHGHPHGDDHRRQPAHGEGDRRRGRRRRLPRRGHAGGQDGADPRRAGGRASSSR